MRSRRLVLRICLLLVTGGVVGLFWTESPRQSQAQQPNVAGFYNGVGACVECHSEKPKEERKFPTDFCLLDEYTVWHGKDKHSQGYEVLTNERSKRMGQLLGIDDVTKSEDCLGCHAVIVKEGEQTGQNFRIEDGVSCDACHGKSGLWLGLHFSLKGWRTLPVQQKAQFGMLDVRDPITRAKMCASCHVGNTEQNKVVSHEMYAAGHPPLPGFEIETFATSQPRHWRYWGEKDKEIQKQFKYDDAQLYRTKLAVVGALVSLREAVGLFGSQATKRGDNWPDLAQFDCTACHHDLTKPQDSWRIARGFEAWRLLPKTEITPGRPLMREWTSVLAIIALEHAGHDAAAIKAQFHPLHDALNSHVYGDSKAVAEATTKITAWLDPIITELNGKLLTTADGNKLIASIVDKAASEDHTVDYDSARQFAWMLQIVDGDVNGDKPSPVKETLSQLAKPLNIKLPAGLEYQIDKQLGDALQTLADYDPAKVRAAFQELKAKL